LTSGCGWPHGLRHKVVRDARTGKRRVDKLYGVHLLDGTEEWILVHVEVQVRPDRRLPERLYRYHCRIAIQATSLEAFARELKA
jgi:hypothetical protein